MRDSTLEGSCRGHAGDRSKLKWLLFACAFLIALGVAYSASAPEAEARVAVSSGSSSFAGGVVRRPVPPPPIARNDRFTVAENNVLRIPARGVLRNDRGVGLRAFKAANPRNGRLVLRRNGSLVYTPNRNFAGRDSFVYRARDNRGRMNAARVTIVVRRGPPPIARNVSYRTNENETLGINAPGVLGNDRGANLTAVKLSDPANGSASLNRNGSFTYTPDTDFSGDDSFRYQARDHHGRVSAATVDITVDLVNRPPEINGVTADPDELDEGGTSTITVDAADRETADEDLVYEFDCDGDDDFEIGPQSGNEAECTFPQDGTRTVNVRVTDEAGASDTRSVDVPVNNVAPVLTAPDDQTSDEGEDKAFDLGSFTDPGNDEPWKVDVDWGDGNTTDFEVEDGDRLPDGSFDLERSHTYSDDGNYDVDVTVEEAGDNPESDSKTFEVSVENVAPTVNLTGDAEANEGDEKKYSFTVSDPGRSDTFTVPDGFPDCGDGGGLVEDSLQTDVDGGSFECFFPDGPASTTVGIKVEDGSGEASNVAEREVDIANVPPEVDAADDQSSDEGEDKSFDLGTFTDPGTDGPWTVTVDWGDGSTDDTFEVGGATDAFPASSPGDLGTRDHAYDDNDTYTVTVTVAEAGDTSPPSDSDTFEVEVANVAPTAKLENNGPKDEGEPVTVSFTDQSDPSEADTNAGFRYAYNCDGSEFDPAPSYDDLAGSAASEECTYNDGEHTVRALIMDKDGGFTEHETTFTVNNLPPTATPQSVTAQEETPTTITLEGTDPSEGLQNPDTLTFEITAPPDGGTLYEGDDTSGTEIATATEADPFELSGDEVTYLPDDAFAGGDGFDFKANDGKAKSAAARVAITVISADPARTTITAVPTKIVADGTSTSEITVQLKDGDGDDVKTGAGYTVYLETTAGTLSNVANNGDGTFTATLTSDTTAGEAPITGKLSGGGMSEEPITDDATVAFIHGPLDGFTVEKAGGGDIGTQLAGTAFDVRVAAVDANGNTVKSFTGTVAFTSTPSGGISGGGNSANFTEGVLSSHSITFGTPGEFRLVATESGGKSGTSNQFAVEAPPNAVDDGPGANSAPGDAYHTPFNTTFNLSGPGVMSNDDRGFPQANVVSFGGRDLGGNVGSHNAGSTVSPIPVIPNDDRFAGVSENNNGSLTVNANGSVSFTPPEGFTGVYEFRYRIENSRDSSDALVRIAVGERPQAVGDPYSHILVGNVPIDTQTSTNFSVKDNDAGSATSLTLGTASNGTADLKSNGTFTFAPNAGHEGPASFTYTVKNGFGASSPATVSMSVENVVWFVNAGASSNGDGTFGSPFDCLTGTGCFSAAASDEANDRIFLRGGAYAGGLTLKDGQRLIGQGASGTFGSAQNANVAWPADSGAEPSVGGTAPTITTSASSTNGVNLGSGNTLRGFTVGDTTGSGINGDGFGTLSVSEVGITGSGQALNLLNGTLSGSLTGVTSASGANNIRLSTVGTNGTFDLGSGALSGASAISFRVASGNGSFTYSGNITQNSNASLVNVAPTNTGTLTFTGTLTATNGNGLQFSNADGTYNFNGTTTLNGGDAGVDVVGGSSGTIRIADGTGSASITNPSGNAVNISGSNPTFTYGDSITKTNNTTTGILVQNNTGGTINFSGTTKTLTSTGTNPAVSLSNNGNTAINFTNGDLVVTGTNNAPGFSATGGGTVRVSGTGNTISTASGTALNVANTTIGSSGLTFQSISANGAANGIVLNNTGTVGGLTVNGTGTTVGSGGTVQNISGRGAS